MSILKQLWNDQQGAILSAELVLLGTLGIVGATVGAKMASTAIDDELKELSYAFRSLDQSYSYQGFSGCNAATAGSCYQQPAVKKSLKELRAMEKGLPKSSKKKSRKHAPKRRKPAPSKKRFNDQRKPATRHRPTSA